jgi:hypothetical protein
MGHAGPTILSNTQRVHFDPISQEAETADVVAEIASQNPDF